ncbi:MAG: hypothetical protein PHP31_07950 [Lentimicrobiaceae bacterium]|nr:hypothetical protein [Lentimicrobiaceae bacterium]
MDAKEYNIQKLIDIENLSVRASNTCKRLALNNLSEIIAYYKVYGNFLDGRNCGVKTNSELVNIVEKYLSKEIYISEEEEGTIFNRLQNLCQKKYNTTSFTTEKYRDSFIKNKFNLVVFVSELMDNFLNHKELLVVRKCFFKNTAEYDMNLAQIAEDNDVSSERLRQISILIHHKIERVISDIKKVDANLANRVDVKFNQNDNIIVFNKELSQQIYENKYEASYIALVYRYLYEEYELYPNHRDRGANFYLIKTSLVQVFNFGMFIKKLEGNLKKLHKTDYICNDTKLLNKFLINKHPLTQEIVDACYTILSKTVGVSTDKEGRFVIKRNSHVKISEYILKIFEGHKEPIDISTLISELKNRYGVDYSGKKQNLRSYLLNVEEVLPIGKTGTYKLKSWENVKSGTIRDLVKDYLLKFDEPKHIKDIHAYISKYRNTSLYSLKNNIGLDQSGTFDIFQYGYIGLKSKKYKNITIKKV